LSVSGDRAAELMHVALERLRPFLPPDAQVDMRLGRTMRVSATSDRAAGGSVRIGALGRTLSPWLPSSVAARVTAHDAVERILSAVYGMGACTIETRLADERVHVTFQLPDDEPGTRREIEPLPLELCQ
jgi:hypothetical protein